MYECKICNAQFKHKGSLRRHCENKHDGLGYDNSHVCKFCNAKFGSYQSLGAHVVFCNMNPNKKKTIEKLRTSSSGRKHSKETKEKLSAIRSKIIEEQGSGGFKNIRWFRIKNIENEEFICRGKWEKKVAERLNSLGIKWIRKVYLRWIDEEGIKRTYSPDFFVPELDLYLEVKGYFSNKDKNKLKRVLSQNEIKLCMLFSEHIERIDEIDRKELSELWERIPSVL